MQLPIETIFWQGKASYDNKDYENAKTQFSTLVHQLPNAENLYWYAKALMAIKNYPVAMETFESAIAYKTTYNDNYFEQKKYGAEAYYAAAICLEKMGDIDKAMTYITKARDADKKNTRYSKIYTDIRTKQLLQERCVENEKLVQQDPDNVTYLANLVKAYSNLKTREGNAAAIEHLLRLITLSNKEPISAKEMAVLYAELARLYKENGDYGLAASWYSKAVVLQPENPNYMLKAAQTHRLNKDEDQAQAYFEDLLNYQQSLPASATNNMFMTYYLYECNQDARSAISSYRLQLLASPNNPAIYQNLGYIYEMNGDRVLALNFWCEAIMAVSPPKNADTQHLITISTNNLCQTLVRLKKEDLTKLDIDALVKVILETPHKHKTRILKLLLDDKHVLGQRFLKDNKNVDKDMIYTIIRAIPDLRKEYLTRACKIEDDMLFDICHRDRRLKSAVMGSTLQQMEKELQELTKYDAFLAVSVQKIPVQKKFQELLKQIPKGFLSPYKMEPVKVGFLIGYFNQYANEKDSFLAKDYSNFVSNFNAKELLDAVLASDTLPQLPGTKNALLLSCLDAKSILGKQLLCVSNKEYITHMILILSEKKHDLPMKQSILRQILEKDPLAPEYECLHTIFHTARGLGSNVSTKSGELQKLDLALKAIEARQQSSLSMFQFFELGRPCDNKKTANLEDPDLDGFELLCESSVTPQ